MQRLTNRNLSEHQDPIIQLKYIETKGPIEVQIVEKEVSVDRIVEVPVMVESKVDLATLNKMHDKFNEIDVQLHNSYGAYKSIASELEMQRRALVGLKAQRDVDRSRRLMLIRRMKKEQAAHKKTELKLKLAMGAALLLSIAALIVRH